MIEITDKCNCCGCEACVQVCPKACISLMPDAEGFLYPKADKGVCINCRLCEQVCPYLSKHLVLISEPPLTFAAINPDEEVRMHSSSGGVFSRLAETILRDRGVIFGASFNKDWTVHHICATTIDELEPMQGSKYIQSEIGSAYEDVLKYLNNGRKVLFSGTPCQIMGLKLFLRKEYENLVTVECVCQSVPSPGLWKKYLEERVMESKHSVADIVSIAFRDKESGWKAYSCSINFNDGTRYFKNKEMDSWMLGFCGGLFSRPSCTKCPAKSKHSIADLTVGDLWGISQIAPDLDDDKGITTVIIRSKKGGELITNSGVVMLRKLSFNEVVEKNLAITTPTGQNKEREKFWLGVEKGDSIIKTITRMTRVPFRIRLRKALSRLYRTIVPLKK